MNLNEVYITCDLNPKTGLGLLNCSLIRGMTKVVTPKVVPFRSSRHLVPEDIKPFEATADLNKPVLVIQAALNTSAIISKAGFARIVLWETEKPAQGTIRGINESRLAFTFSKWNRDAFYAAGAKTRIVVLPQFCPRSYTYTPRIKKDKLVFGCAGRINKQPERKNIDGVIAAFKSAFPHNNSVELWVKLNEDDVLFDQDPRIKIIREDWNEAQLKAWYENIDVFVHLSRGEGIGFQPLEAMAIGRPLITHLYGGTAEYFTPELGFTVNHKIVPATGMFSKYGTWSDPVISDVVDRMREVYNNDSLLDKYGMLCSQKAQSLTVDKTVTKLVEELEKLYTPEEQTSDYIAPVAK